MLGDDLVQGGSLPVLHVHAHLDEAGGGQVETEGAHSREAAVGFADRLRNGPGDVDVGGAQVHVEGDQGASRTDEHAPRAGIELLGPKVRARPPRT